MEQLNRYYELLVEENEKVNLTRIVEKEDVYLFVFLYMRSEDTCQTIGGQRYEEDNVDTHSRIHERRPAVGQCQGRGRSENLDWR